MQDRLVHDFKQIRSVWRCNNLNHGTSHPTFTNVLVDIGSILTTYHTDLSSKTDQKQVNLIQISKWSDHAAVVFRPLNSTVGSQLLVWWFWSDFIALGSDRFWLVLIRFDSIDCFWFEFDLIRFWWFDSDSISGNRCFRKNLAACRVQNEIWT